VNWSDPKYASLALWGGVLFSFVFTAIIYVAGQRLQAVPHLPDSGIDWYYWRLAAPDTMARITASGFYALHQVALWACIYYAQKNKTKYTPGLHGINLVAMGVNVLFTLLHFVQTHVWYGALAEDVSIFSSQGSVILLLVWVLLMENGRRGLFFGKRLPIGKSILEFAKKYHGYVFSWAIVYTFWYHPMEITTGHLWGFFYTFLLLLQGSLFFTRMHVNKWWMLVQEITVGFHGAIVAYFQAGASGFWPMFAFGFAAMFIITQMHGLGLSQLIKGALAIAFAAAVLLVYSQRGWPQLNEVVRIPIIEYVCVLVLALLIGLGVWIKRTLARRRGREDASEVSVLTSGK
jgi:hypothetical protein